MAREAGRSVLLTTFTRNLAEALDAQFGLLVDSADVRGQVEILNVDRLAYRIAEQARGTRPAIIDGKELAACGQTPRQRRACRTPRLSSTASGSR